VIILYGQAGPHEGYYNSGAYRPAGADPRAAAFLAALE